MHEPSFEAPLSSSTLNGREIPDACSRLDYVVRVTEEAAHKTFALIEQCQSLTQDIVLATHDLTNACRRAQVYAGSPYSLSGLVVSVDETREHIADCAATLRERLSRLAQAQEYQDLSGQVIKRVTSLLDALRASANEGLTRDDADALPLDLRF